MSHLAKLYHYELAYSFMFSPRITYVLSTMLDTQAIVGSRAGVLSTLKHFPLSGGQAFHSFTRGT